MQITEMCSCDYGSQSLSEAHQARDHCSDQDWPKACWCPDLVAQCALKAGLARRVSFRESERVLSIQRLIGGWHGGPTP
jgi:hypothetical protein